MWKIWKTHESIIWIINRYENYAYAYHGHTLTDLHMRKVYTAGPFSGTSQTRYEYEWRIKI